MQLMQLRYCCTLIHTKARAFPSGSPRDAIVVSGVDELMCCADVVLPLATFKVAKFPYFEAENCGTSRYAVGRDGLPLSRTIATELTPSSFAVTSLPLTRLTGCSIDHPAISVPVRGVYPTRRTSCDLSDYVRSSQTLRLLRLRHRCLSQRGLAVDLTRTYYKLWYLTLRSRAQQEEPSSVDNGIAQRRPSHTGTFSSTLGPGRPPARSRARSYDVHTYGAMSSISRSSTAPDTLHSWATCSTRG